MRRRRWIRRLRRALPGQGARYRVKTPIACYVATARADSAPSLVARVGPLPRPIEASNAGVCYVRNTSISDIQSLGANLRFGVRTLSR